MRAHTRTEVLPQNAPGRAAGVLVDGDLVRGHGVGEVQRRLAVARAGGLDLDGVAGVVLFVCIRACAWVCVCRCVEKKETPTSVCMLVAAFINRGKGRPTHHHAQDVPGDLGGLRVEAIIPGPHLHGRGGGEAGEAHLIMCWWIMC